MVDYLHNMMFILFCNQNSVGPEYYKKKENECYNEQYKRIVTLVILKVTAEMIVRIYEGENRSAIDSQQNAGKSYTHAQDLLLDYYLAVDEIIEHTDEDGSKCRDCVDDVERQINLRPAEDEGMDGEDKAADEKDAELQGRAKLQLKVHVLADGVGDYGLHDVSRQLRLDERHIMLVSVDESSHPEEVCDSHHNVGQVVVGYPADYSSLKLDFSRHYQK